jgi:uncharacterized protein YdaU (DUF1376 family)
MGSPDVQAMDLHEVGAYIYLLCTAWQSDRHGYLPDDDEKLRRWAHMSREQWAQSREMLLSKFPIVEEGWRANSRMVLEAEKQATFSESQREKANRRWNASGKPTKSQNDAGALPGHRKEDAGGMPSVSVSVSAFVSALEAVSGAEEKNKNIPAPAEPPDVGTSGDISPRPQLVSISSNTKAKRKRDSIPVSGYHPEFLKAYEAYPKHEEKAESQVEWENAIRRLNAGERDKPPMTDVQACDFLCRAAESVSTKTKRDGTETKFIRSMRRWLLKSTYLDFEPKPKVEYHVLTDAEMQEQWNRDFGVAGNG